MKLSEKIYEQRKRLNLSQEALSDKLEVSRQSVSKWESEQATPELEKLIQMAQLFGISLDELITDKISEPKNVSQADPNQESPNPVQKEPRKNKSRFIIEALILLVVGFLAYSMFEKINALEQELGYVKQNYQNYIQMSESNLNNILAMVQERIISASELLTDYTSEIDTIDMKAKVITYRIQFMAKDETNLNSIDFSALPKSGDPITLTATSVGNGIYSVLLPIDMNQESYLVTARFNTTQGAKNQSLGTFSGYDLIHPSLSIYVDGWTIEGTQNQ
jgi:transcriptional regulator with XRE-family HTH domain